MTQPFSLQNFMKIFSISHGLTDTFTSISFACHQRFICCGHRSWLQPPGPRQLRKQTCLRNTVSLWFPKAVACTRTKHSRYRASCWLAAAASGFFMRDVLWNTQWCIFLVIVRLVEDCGGIRGMYHSETDGIKRNRANETRRNERFRRGQAWEHRVTFSRCFDVLWCPDRHWPCRRWDVTFSNSRAWPSPKSVGSPWRNRLAFHKFNLKAPCPFRGSALTFSELKMDLCYP